GQVLLTVDDVTRRAHYRNAYRTLRRLLDLKTVPVVNENDTVATEEIRFGDNDRLAALVAALVHADLLVLLSDVDALYTGNPARPQARLFWLAHATEPRGRVYLDAGAVRAVVDRRASLLPAGITAIEGRFSAGDPVDLVDPDGRPVARGLVNYDAIELPDLLGRTTLELGPGYGKEVVHRDDLVLL